MKLTNHAGDIATTEYGQFDRFFGTPRTRHASFRLTFTYRTGHHACILLDEVEDIKNELELACIPTMCPMWPNHNGDKRRCQNEAKPALTVQQS